MSHKPSIRGTARYQPAALVPLIHNTDRKLQQNIMASPKPADSILLEDGLYILCQKRGLLIASAACDGRKAYITHICYCCCAERQQTHHIDVYAGSGTQQRDSQQADKECAQDFLPNRHRRCGAAEQTGSLRLCVVENPEALARDGISDTSSFHSDSEPEGHRAQTPICTYPGAEPQATGKSAKGCPSSVVGFVRGAWRKFLDRGHYGGRRRPKQGDSDTDGDDVGRDDASEWDDADVPISDRDHTTLDQSVDESGPGHDFDLFDDVIEEEFPRIKKALQEHERFESADPTAQSLAEKPAPFY
ncbi:hypothetical protein F4861DRAFT_118008 [Xylaria intraflava]|nr:hypothetical protein F4861DRAFT_118008 [Xylaria intraflava]